MMSGEGLLPCLGRHSLFFFFFFFFHLTYSRWTSSLPSCLWPQRIFPSLPGSRLTIFLSRCKFSTLTTRQPMVEFYLLTFPRFPLRKKEHKSYFGKNRTHDFRTSRCAAYLLDHSGDNCVQKMVRNHRSRSSRGTISCVTNDWELRGRSPKVRCLTRLGAHTNLDWVRRVCVYFGVCITTAVIEREFMNARQADQACTEPRGTHARGSMSVEGAIARVTEHPYVRVACTSVSTPLN